MAATRDDVARLAGVSPATVSYVVNNGPRPVSEQTRLEVLDAIAKLGYQPSTIARSLKTKRTATIGLLVGDIMNPIMSAIAKGIEDALQPLGYNMILCNSDEDPQMELTQLTMLVSKQVDGMILLPTGENTKFLLSLGQHRRLPIVLLDRRIEHLPCDCVLFDNVEGARQATAHLIAQGHRRIGLISLPHHMTPGRERHNGYVQALQAAHLAVDPQLQVEGSFKAQDGRRLVTKLLAVPHPPTALLVCSNRLLEGVLRYAKENGIALPRDLAVAVFDDVPYYAYATPSITAVATDLKLLGRHAARMLEWRISQSDSVEAQVVRIPSTLQVRESTLATPQPPPEGAHPVERS